MKRKQQLLLLATIIWVLALPVMSLAQVERAPVLIIQGIPNATADPPNVRTQVSVFDKETGLSIQGLTAESFSIVEHEAAVPIQAISYEQVGLAVVAIIDRGGLYSAGKIDQVIEFTHDLQDTLAADSPLNRLAIVSVNNERAAAAQSIERIFSINFMPESDDGQGIADALDIAKVPLTGNTPMYDGLQEALRLLRNNPDADVRNMLRNRRKVIILFTNGFEGENEEALATDIINQANAAGISVYIVGMAPTDNANRNLSRLATQTNGLHQRHNNYDETTKTQVRDLFGRIVTQSSQYFLTHQTYLVEGTYRLSVKVDVGTRSAEDRTEFISVLKRPSVTLTSPDNGVMVTVPYSDTLESYLPVYIPLRVSVRTPVGAVMPREVRYYAGSDLIGSSTAGPEFAIEWYVSNLVTATFESQVIEYTLSAIAIDGWLPDAQIPTTSIQATVTWEPKPPLTTLELLWLWLKANWWLLIILIGLLIGLIVLFILNARMKGELAKKIRSGTTSVLRGMTRPLSALQAPAQGKLVIVQGANIGKEFRLAGQVIKVGRDPQFCDFALYDEYVSNPHFNIYMDQGNFYIEDGGSKNQTKLNGTILPPNQRQFLQPDAIIDVGATRLQFKRLGGKTQPLGAYPQPTPGAGGQPQGAAGWGGPTQVAPQAQQPYPQTQPAPGAYPGGPQPYPPTQPAPGGAPGVPPQHYPPTQVVPGGSQRGQPTQPQQQPPAQPGNPNNPHKP